MLCMRRAIERKMVYSRSRSRQSRLGRTQISSEVLRDTCTRGYQSAGGTSEIVGKSLLRETSRSSLLREVDAAEVVFEYRGDDMP